jgi:hypothetical protein
MATGGGDCHLASGPRYCLGKDRWKGQGAAMDDPGKMGNGSEESQPQQGADETRAGAGEVPNAGVESPSPAQGSSSQVGQATITPPAIAAGAGGVGGNRIISLQTKLLVGVSAAVIVGMYLVIHFDVVQKVVQLNEDLGLSSTAFYSAFLAALAGIVIVSLAFTLSPDIDEVRFVITLALCGASLGWIAGMYLSPQNTPEEQAFGSFKTAIAGVLSGYILSKLQSIFTKLLDDGTILTKLFLQRTLFFVTPALLTIGTVYSVREYKNQTVQIITSEERSQGAAVDFRSLQEKAVDVPPDGTKRFMAEANFPGDTSVTWSIVPVQEHQNDAASTFGAIDKDGSYKAPSTTCEKCFYVMAQSNYDPTKIARRQVSVGQPKAAGPGSNVRNKPPDNTKGATSTH